MSNSSLQTLSYAEEPVSIVQSLHIKHEFNYVDTGVQRCRILTKPYLIKKAIREEREHK